MRKQIATPRGLAALPFLLEGSLEAFAVDAEALLLSKLLEELGRDAVGLVEIKDGAAGNGILTAPLEPFELALSDIGAGIQGPREPLLLLPQLSGHDLAPFPEFREDITHQIHDHRYQAVEERSVQPELAAVSKGATDDPAQHVAATLIRRDHPVSHQERGSAQVIGDHPVGGGELVRGIVGTLHELCHGVDDRHKEIGLIVGLDPLHDHGKPLEPGAGVDTGFR